MPSSFDGLVTEYLKRIHLIHARGDAREESYYSSLEQFIRDYGVSTNRETEVTILPKKTEAGNPDFRVWDGISQITGYIEAKPPSTISLDHIETSKQLIRYREAFPNLILTNFTEFRLYRDGHRLGMPIKVSDLQLRQGFPDGFATENRDALKELLDIFFGFALPSISLIKDLAEILAYKAGIMRDYVVLPSLDRGEDNYFAWLHRSFKRHLIEGLEKDRFADLFSQTFTYGLFIARYQFEIQERWYEKEISGLPFTTKTAYDFIQRSFGILREVFKVISTQDMPDDMRIIVDDIVDILNHTDTYTLLRGWSKGGRRDPTYHLYETFLRKYDKDRKQKLGIFYTPLEVVSYIVNSVHCLLKDQHLFDAPDGLATISAEVPNASVTLLEPAVGTGTFYATAIEKALDEVTSKYSSSPGFVSDFIRSHILPHFFAFEIEMAPYVVSHLKVLFGLRNRGFDFTEGDRLNIFLTNTLELHQKTVPEIVGFFEQTLVTEQKHAHRVKTKAPILVVIGNPPYSVSSQNEVTSDTQFGKFYDGYKEVVRKEETNIQPLSNDYVKFIAFAHWKIVQAGRGIVAMITDNSYIDGLIHREMRRKIISDFDVIHILNLHGSARRPCETADGGKDENVFDITEGVAICLLVKSEKKTKKKVLYSELVGPRSTKSRYLDEHTVADTAWQEIEPQAPNWFLVPRDYESSEQYEKFCSIRHIFITKSTGVKTHRDRFVVAFSKEELRSRLEMLVHPATYSSSTLQDKFKLKDTRTWKLDGARKALAEDGIRDDLFRMYAYRPFDRRWVYQSRILIDRPRAEFLWDLSDRDPAIVTTRQLAVLPFAHAFVADRTPDICLASLRTKESSYVFPLRITLRPKESPTDKDKIVDEPAASMKRESNINDKFAEWLMASYKEAVALEDIFAYLYAILYSPSFRRRYGDSLRIEFPRIPIAKEHGLFMRVSQLGKELVELHLLISPPPGGLLSRFKGENDGKVSKVVYHNRSEKLFINESQYFDGVSAELWDYHVGSYRVLESWLKARKGRSLSSGDITHFVNVISVLDRTTKIQREIDTIFGEVQDELIVFKPKKRIRQ